MSRSIVFKRNDHGQWRSLLSEMCSFMPLRGIADDARRIIALDSDDSATLHAHHDQHVDAAALVDVLDRPRAEAWTGVRFGPQESMEWLHLWLACTLDNALSRMLVEQAAVERGTVTTRFGWAPMATTENDTLAYLTIRPDDLAPDGRTLYEIGVISHGPDRNVLGDQVVNAIRTWDRGYRSRIADFEIHPTEALPTKPEPGRFCVETPHGLIIISWR